MTVHRVKFLIIKPTRCTDFSNLFLERNSTCFGQFLCRASGIFHCTHSYGIRVCHTVCHQDGTAFPSWSCSQAVCKPVWHIPLLCVQWKTPDDEQRNCPKHVEFLSKNKFKKSVHLVGFNIRNSLYNKHMQILHQSVTIITNNRAPNLKGNYYIRLPCLGMCFKV